MMHTQMHQVAGSIKGARDVCSHVEYPLTGPNICMDIAIFETHQILHQIIENW